MAVPEILELPFFSLEYDPEKAYFLRKLPDGAVDLGKGKFQWKGKIFCLPANGNSETKILDKPVIKGKDILALARRGYNPLIKSGPLMADREDRLMELGLTGGTLTTQGEKKDRKAHGEKKEAEKLLEIEIVLRMGKVSPDKWLLLDGLPHHRLFDNRIYEIIPDDVLTLIAKNKLRGAEIPAFADNYARLIYVFADELLYKLLAQDAIFINPADVSLVLYCRSIMEKKVGKAMVYPALKYENKRYSAYALSQYYHRKYLPLKGRWLRRETLERLGLGPLGCFINGESLKPSELKAKDFLAGGGEALKILSQAENSGGLETDENYWRNHGKEEEIFSSHLEFLRHWGFSGGIIAEREKAAPFLAAWLTDLAELQKDNKALEEGPSLFSLPDEGRVLVLMPKKFWDQRLCRDLPQSGEGPLRVPAERWPGADSVWDPAFRGIGLNFFEALITDRAINTETRTKRYRGRAWDLLVVVGLDEAANPEQILRQLETIPSRLRLGLFFSASGLFGNAEAARIKALFNIKGEALKYEKYLIRETGDLLSLPAPPPNPGLLQKPPWPVEDNYFVFGSARFLVDAKFQNIPVAQYLQEQKEFYNTGKKCQFIPAETLTYKSLTKEEKNYFLYWRSEFRKGRAWECSPAYLFIYAKELILRMDATHSANETLNELCRLWQTYREIFPQTFGTFPCWLLDFAVIYHADLDRGVLSTALNDVFSDLAEASISANTWGLLLDINLHKKYVEENHSLQWKDFLPLTKKSGYKSYESNLSRLLFSAGDEAMNNLDRALRKYYGKKLLEFFCPLPPLKETFTAFVSISDLGYSAYTAEWLSYSRHKPFAKFLDSLAAYLEYRIIKTVDPDNRNSAPFFDPVWKYLCGFDEAPPPELEDLVMPKTANNIIDDSWLHLEEDKINRLREESDAVMEMLKIINLDYKFEDEDHFEATTQPMASPTIPDLARQTIADKTHPDLAQFIAGLDLLSRSCLELLSQDKGQELETFARENNTMAELMIDSINEQFLSEYGDLLIENDLDQEPQIGEEYRDEVLWALTFQNA
ncbi:MAG: TerB N-terminal domain-containing protein [Treponema sp.]|jgi:hypothetical protein|nr:TerB N-terminal domain-containing protein [Treponema sp.]